MLIPVGFYQESASGPTVSPNTTNLYKLYFSSTGTSYARIRFNSDGEEYSNSSANLTTMAANRGTWLDSGAASDVWVERTINSGSLNNDDPGAGRLNLGTSRTYGVTYTAPPQGSQACNVTFDFYDAASGGNLLTSYTITLTAETSAA